MMESSGGAVEPRLAAIQTWLHGHIEIASARVSRHGCRVDDEVLEQGDIQFFFRPSVQPAEADEYVIGVQSLFAILSPAGGRDHRRMRIGRKRMPSSAKDRFWARIERVGSLQRVLGNALESDRYTTKTRGERYQPAARPIAHGSYELVRHGDHTHFTYHVEPFLFEDAPDEVSIAEMGSHVVLFEKASGRAKWTAQGNIAQLDEEGAELVLVGACRGDSPDDART